jgi:hypothetical protein
MVLATAMTYNMGVMETTATLEPAATETSQDFTKVVRIGVIKPEYTMTGYSVFCKIKYKGGNLSISGVEGPNRHGGARGACGQINMRLKPTGFTSFAKGWDASKVAQFLKIWDAWHLNDMNAGTPKQTALLKAKFYTEDRKYPENDYTHACEFLDAHGLLIDKHPVTGEDYRYGTACLKVAVPEGVLTWLKALPDTDHKNTWTAQE